MRLVVGSAVIVRASLRLRGEPGMSIAVPAVLLICAGSLLILGFWTRVAGTSVAVIEIWKILMLAGDKWGWLLMATLGAALAMLGPGLWSIDARRYGWKRIETTSRKNRP